MSAIKFMDLDLFIWHQTKYATIFSPRLSPERETYVILGWYPMFQRLTSPKVAYIYEQDQDEVTNILQNPYRFVERIVGTPDLQSPAGVRFVERVDEFKVVAMKWQLVDQYQK